MSIKDSVKVVIDDLTARKIEFIEAINNLDNAINLLTNLYEFASPISTLTSRSNRRAPINYKPLIYKLLIANKPNGCNTQKLAVGIAAIVNNGASHDTIYQYIYKVLPKYMEIHEILKVGKDWVILPKGEKVYEELVNDAKSEVCGEGSSNSLDEGNT